MYKLRKPLIVFEGIEGSGKTTQINNVKKFLKKKKLQFISIREPGGSKNSEKIRKLILNDNSNFNIYTDLLLYLASRCENIDKLIKKNYKKKIIIIDRFFYSTFAYQHFGMGINLKFIEKINNQILQKIKPDLIYLNIVNESNMKKRLKLRKNKNRYDKFKFSFYKKVQMGYLKMLKNKNNVEIIDSSKTLIDNKIQIINRLKKVI